ncbi:MAG TPA: class I SAM-dependent methyltransferase [Candidatus Acidoferrales bacterium]|nr:class I SAM-dependent methyltransferase [Candidatus Acidoferrales bacterium]
MPAESHYDAITSIAEFYDATLVYQERKDVEFYVAEARASGGPVLELGCGTGRVLIPTARAGIAITGLDASANMLARCRAKLETEPETVRARATLVRGDLAAFDLGRQFALITIPFRPFQHLLTVEQQLGCLRSARRHLAPRARLIFDVFHVDPSSVYDKAWMEEKEDAPAARLPDGRIVRRTVRIAAFHRAAQINDVEFCWYITHTNGRREEVRWRTALRYSYRFELEHLLARAGFAVVSLYGDINRAPYGDDSPDMIFVAEAAAA